MPEKAPETQKIRIKLRSYDYRMLDDSLTRIVDTVQRTGANLIGPVLLPTSVRRYTVLRSPHADKKSREQFEMRVHKRLVDIVDPTPRTVEELRNLDLPAGVDVAIQLPRMES
ncbi:MAG: 30S ribosomal protein S10 [Elusimicrobia bacterium]|nr:30S ribosomal protein S10 [Candidatus Obscuribacterium magneticum]